MRVRSVVVLLASAGAAGVVACGDSTALEAGVTVQFRAAGSGAGSASAPVLGPAAAVFTELPVTGSNGALVLQEAWLIIDEFKLERVEGACDEAAAEGCENFEAPPAFVALPLEGEATGTVVQDAVPVGTYSELKFETTAPGDDATLLQEVRQQVPDWPSGASALVVGTFTPTDGTLTSFRVYLDAEVKVELAFDEPLVVEEGGSQLVMVFVDPSIWFVNADGTVIELSQFDYDLTGEVLKFEAKFANGFTKIEFN